MRIFCYNFPFKYHKVGGSLPRWLRFYGKFEAKAVTVSNFALCWFFLEASWGFISILNVKVPLNFTSK